MCRRKLYLCFSQYILGVQKIKRDRKKKIQEKSDTETITQEILEAILTVNDCPPETVNVWVNINKH